MTLELPGSEWVAGETIEGILLVTPKKSSDIQIPQPSSPSCSSNNWSVTWKLKGILARFLRKDTVVEQEINIYSGRPA